MKIKSLINTYLLFMAVVLLSLRALGQSTDTLKYKFDLKIGGQRKRGVISQTTLKVSSNKELENKNLVLTNLSSYAYNQVNGVNVADDWDIRSYAMLKLNSTTKLLPVIAHNYFKNVLYRIARSHRAMAGVKIIPLNQYKDFSFLVGGGYEFSSYKGEVFMESPVVSSQRNFPLGFFKFSWKHKFGKHRILVDYNFFSVQSFKEVKDYSLWLACGVSVPLDKKISIGLNYEFRFRNVHLSDIPNNNDLLLFNITFNHSN